MLEVRTNDSFAELHVDGEFVASTVDMELISRLPKLAHKLGFEYSLVHGEWNRKQQFIPRSVE
jgi:hypothetical protein